MTWNYRIVKYHDPNQGYGLHEVYYDQQGEPVTIGAAPAIFVTDMEDGPEGIVTNLKKALNDAQTRAVLDEPRAQPRIRL